MQQQITTTIRLEGVTPAAEWPRWGTEREAILRLGDADIVFPADPEARAEIAFDMIACLNEIRNEAIKRALTPSQAEVRHERLTEGVAG